MNGVTVGRWVIPESELEERFETTGGPGGQHANRNATQVVLRLDVAASSLPDAVRERIATRLGDPVEVVAGDSRSQWRNRAMARRRLAQRLQAALVETLPRRPTRPSRRAVENRLAAKRARSELKRRRRRPDEDSP